MDENMHVELHDESFSTTFNESTNCSIVDEMISVEKVLVDDDIVEMPHELTDNSMRCTSQVMLEDFSPSSQDSDSLCEC